MKSLARAIALLSALAAAQATAADASSRMVDSAIGSAANNYSAIARDIWEYAEVGYQEVKSSARLRGALEAAGFAVETGLADIPTSFVASYGKGEPVIGILAEFDALPGVSQMDVPERMPVPGGNAGHACGHHLFGTGSVAAAITVKEWLEDTGSQGTIRLYGTPAEEGGSGKVYMVRAGLFDDVDTVIHWHASDRNSALPGTTLANRSAKFRFYGKASHAAAAPERGRSALDGVEAMNMMVNMMREHVPSSTRIHHVITRGGNAPNVVPEFAEVFYYVRAPSPDDILPIWEWVENAADGAAIGTQTQVQWEIIHGNYNILPNVTLARVMHESLETFGGIEYDREEQRFAETLVATYNGRPPRALGSQQQIAPWTEDIQRSSGSSDVGDVSWMAPTVGLNTATWVPGTAAHSWQAVAAGGTSIGSKGMLLAARSMALTAIRLYEDPLLVAQAQEEWLELRGGKRINYQPLLGDRDPPLDYRK